MSFRLTRRSLEASRNPGKLKNWIGSLRHDAERFHNIFLAAAFFSSLTFEHGFRSPADVMSEEQTFRCEVNGSLPLSGHRSLVFKMKSKTYNGEVRSSEKDFETLQLGAFATPGLLLAQGHEDLTAGSGLNPDLSTVRPFRRARANHPGASIMLGGRSLDENHPSISSCGPGD